MSIHPPARVHHLRSLDGGADSALPVEEGGLSADITLAVVGLLKESTGRAPTSARTFVTSGLAVVLLRDCLTDSEKALAGEGNVSLVAKTRDAVHEHIRPEASAAVERLTGKQVIAYLCDQGEGPDFALIAFVLAEAS